MTIHLENLIGSCQGLTRSLVMLAGMRDLIPHELIGHAHSDAEYKERGSSHKSELSPILQKTKSFNL